MWLFVQFVLAAVVSLVVAWLVEVVNVPSPWRWGIPAALFAISVSLWIVEKIRAGWNRRREQRGGRPAGQARTAGRS